MKSCKTGLLMNSNLEEKKNGGLLEWDDKKEEFEEECNDEDKVFDVLSLRKMVKMKRRRANVACLQLEQERMAAAEKTMGMILRLQNEIGRSIENLNNNNAEVVVLSSSNFKRWKEDFEFVLGMDDIDQALHEDEPPSLTDSSTTAEKEFYAK
ncbi:hypothetical protein CQW23_19494 [Capsicum baccatum]|uniref:GTD-binding domain-containing protein n=1 Tax=Capsicum baccatum TaxID=33114 RepID=A0A2G2W5Y6_CAPBA|nr:hypothetical protein CQW23_19494 [Capsicum baccatum]